MEICLPLYRVCVHEFYHCTNVWVCRCTKQRSWVTNQTQSKDRAYHFCWLDGCSRVMLCPCFFFFFCSTPVWHSLCLQDDSQRFSIKPNKGSQFSFHLFIKQYLFVTIFWLTGNPQNTPQSKYQTDHVHIYTLTHMAGLFILYWQET